MQPTVIRLFGVVVGAKAEEFRASSGKPVASRRKSLLALLILYSLYLHSFRDLIQSNPRLIRYRRITNAGFGYFQGFFRGEVGQL